MADRTLVLFWDAPGGVRARIVKLPDPSSALRLAARAIFDDDGADLVAIFDCDVSSSDLSKHISAGRHLADLPGITGLCRAHREGAEALEVMRLHQPADNVVN